MPNYRKKSEFVDAIQFTGDNFEEIIKWSQGKCSASVFINLVTKANLATFLEISGYKTNITVQVGSWLVWQSNADVKVLENEQFLRHFSPIWETAPGVPDCFNYWRCGRIKATDDFVYRDPKSPPTGTVLADIWQPSDVTREWKLYDGHQGKWISITRYFTPFALGLLWGTDSAILAKPAPLPKFVQDLTLVGSGDIHWSTAGTEFKAGDRVRCTVEKVC